MKLTFYILLAVLFSLFACADEHDTIGTGQENPDSTEWEMAVMPTMDCLPLFLAYDHHFFSEAGLSVGLKLYQAQMDVDTALLKKHVICAATDLVRVEHLRQQGLSLQCVTRTDARWQLISKRTARIKKLDQLDDKMLAMTRYSATDMMADLVIDSVKLKSERVFRIQVNDVGIRLNMLQADIMDAMFLPEPQATTARNLKGNVILDTQKEDLQLGTLVFINDSTKVSEDKVKSFLTAYNRSVDSLNEYGIHAYDDILEQYLNITRPTIDSLPNKYQYKHAEKPRQKDIERVKQWWSKRQDSMKYVEKRYIQ